MGGFLSGLGAAVGGAGQSAQTLGAQIREQQHQHRENALRLDALQREQLANRIEQHARQYGGDVGEQLGLLADEVHAAPQGADWLSYHQKVNSIVQKARAAQAAARMAGQGGAGMGGAGMGAGAVPGVQPVQPSNAQPPLTGLLGPAVDPASSPGAQSASPAPLAAQSPVNPAQGGGLGQGAAFPVPDAAASTSPSATGAAAQAGGSVRGAAAGPGSQNPAIPPVNFGRSLDTFNASGYIDPLVEALIPGQASLALANQRMPIVQSILDRMKPTESGQMPDFNSLMRVGAELSNYGVQDGMGNMIGPMVSLMTGQNAPGMTTVAALEANSPGFLASQGYDTQSLDPNTPVRVMLNKITHAPVSAFLQSVPNRVVQTAEGIQLLDPRTGQVTGSVPGTPIGMAGSTSSQTKIVPGQLPETTVSSRQRTLPGGAVAGTGAVQSVRPGIPPAGAGGGTRNAPAVPGMIPPVGSGASGSSTPGSGGLIERKYQDWAAGGPPPAGKELTAVQEYARRNNLPTPQPMSPRGQQAMATLDPIMSEVDRALQTMDSLKIDKMGKTDLIEAYGKYKLGIDTPLAAFLADIGFADIRSAAQALQGTGSRAFPILTKALEHTPKLSMLTMDEPSLIRKKLGEMKIRLEEARKAVMDDEKKSGVLSGAPPVPAAGQQSDPLGIR